MNKKARLFLLFFPLSIPEISDPVSEKPKNVQQIKGVSYNTGTVSHVDKTPFPSPLKIYFLTAKTLYAYLSVNQCQDCGA